MKSGVDKAGKSGISIATKMALSEYKTLMEKVSLNGETVLASTSARTAEVQKLIDNLASKVDGDLMEWISLKEISLVLTSKITHYVMQVSWVPI